MSFPRFNLMTLHLHEIFTCVRNQAMLQIHPQQQYIVRG